MHGDVVYSDQLTTRRGRPPSSSRRQGRSRWHPRRALPDALHGRGTKEHNSPTSRHHCSLHAARGCQTLNNLLFVPSSRCMYVLPTSYMRRQLLRDDDDDEKRPRASPSKQLFVHALSRVLIDVCAHQQSSLTGESEVVHKTREAPFVVSGTQVRR